MDSVQLGDGLDRNGAERDDANERDAIQREEPIGSSPYDPAGNMTALLPGGAMQFRYDAENRQIAETNSGGLSATYVYDGDGKRAELRDGVGSLGRVTM